MKKKYLYSLLCMALAICGFTAWSAAGGVNPFADGDEAVALNPVLDKCVPAEGRTVKEISYILLTFPENETDIKINPDFTKAALGTIGHYNSSAGGFNQSVHAIRKTDIDKFDKLLDGKEVASNQIVYHLATPVTVEEAGEYSITFGADVFISGTTGNTNPQFKYFFNIDPNYGDAPEPLTINTEACLPAANSVIYELSYVVLTFGEDQKDIKLNPEFTTTNVGFIATALSGSITEAFKTENAADFLTHEVNGEALADNQIAIKLATPIVGTYIQEYRLCINKGAFISGATGGVLDGAVEYNFTMTTAPLEERPVLSTEPARGSTVVAPVNMIIFTVDEDMKNVDKNTHFVGDKGSIVNTDTNEVVDNFTSGSWKYKIDGQTLPANQLAYILSTPLGAGNYHVSLAGGVLKNKTYQNAPYEFNFVVEAAPLTVNTEACVPAAGATVNVLKDIVLTFAESETNIKVNPDYTSSVLGLVSHKEGTSSKYDEMMRDKAAFDNLLDGKPVAANQIVIHLQNPITVEEANTYTIQIMANALISETTGGVNLSIRYDFTIEPAVSQPLPVVATEPADGSTVDAPVNMLIITFDPKMDPVDVTADFDGDMGALINVETNQVIDDWSNGDLLFSVDGNKLPGNQLAYKLSKPLEAGTYKATFGEGLFTGGEGNDKNVNAKIEFTFTVKGEDGPVETFDYGFTYASWAINNNYDYTLRRATNKFGTNITFIDLPKGAALNSSISAAKWVRESDGTVVEAALKDFYGSLMMFTDSADWPSEPFGVWTCTLPQGLITSDGMESQEKTIRLTWIDPNAEPPRPEFEVTRFSFFDTPDSFANLEGKPVGAPANMMYTLWNTVEGGQDMMNWESDPKSIACLNSNRGFVINTNWDEWIQCFIAEVKRKDGAGEIDVWNQETVQEVYGYGNVCKNYVGSSADDCEAYQHPLLGCGGNEDTREYQAGVEYTLDIWFYDSMMKRGVDNNEHNLACGSYHLEFTGATVPFSYSDIASLVSISPAPVNGTELGLAAETPGELKSVTEPITFTWSAPVTMTAKYSLGSGAGLADVQSCTSNEDGTVWTVVPGSACISNGEGGYLDVFEFDVQAIDADGHYVKGNVGEKRNTMFVPQFNFNDILSGVNGISMDRGDVKVLSHNGEIIVSGLEDGMKVSLYAVTGLKIAEKAAADSTAVFSNIVPGTYLITVASPNGAKGAIKLQHK